MEGFDEINRVYSYLFYASGAIIAALSVVLSNGYVSVVALLMFVVSAAEFRSGHIINNLLIRQSLVVEVCNGYKISGPFEAGVRKVGKGYKAKAVAILNIGKNTAQGTDFLRNFIDNYHEPFGLGIELNEIDKNRILEGLETRRRMKEIELNRIMPANRNKAGVLRRELEVIGSEIESLRASEKSLEVLMSVTSIARSESEYQALLEASAGIRRVADAFSSASGTGYEILKGERLAEFLEASG